MGLEPIMEITRSSRPGYRSAQDVAHFLRYREVREPL